MLRLIQKSLPKIETRNIVDTFYSLAKMKDHHPDEVWYKYVLGDMIKELTSRNNLEHMEIAYLSKGLVNFSTYFKKD